MFAVIESGGKQHRVTEGEVLRLEKLPAEPGATVEFDRVMMVGNGDKLSIGQPYVEGGRVSAEVLSQGKGKKIRIIKFRRRQNYRRTGGHRQSFTEVRITGISGV